MDEKLISSIKPLKENLVLSVIKLRKKSVYSYKGSDDPSLSHIVNEQLILVCATGAVYSWM